MRSWLSSAPIAVRLVVSCVILTTGLSGCSNGSGASGSSSSGSSSGTGTTTGTGTTVAASPTVTAVSPATVVAGATATTLTITGTNFGSTSTVQVGSAVVPTTLVSATQLTAAVPPAQLASGALLPVIVLNASATSVGGAVVNLEVDNPSPTLTQFTPVTLLASTAGTILAVTGTGFVPTTTIQVNGAARSTAFVSGTQVNVLLTTADLAASGTLQLTAVNGLPGGGTSAAASLPVNNPVPMAASLSPSTVTTGTTTPTTITVTGTGFVPGAAALVGTSARASTVVSSTQLTFALTAADMAASVRLPIYVQNPAPGGGTSTPALALTVAAVTPTPVITSVTPTAFVAGSAASSITVVGTNLVAGCIVQWNGSALSTTSYTSNLNPTYLSGAVPANLIATTGSASVTANCPTATPSLSNAIRVAINNPPVPTLTAISPGSGPINTATKLTFAGTGFNSGSTVSLNGVVLSGATVSGSTSISVTVPASSLLLPGNSTFTVTTPAPGGGTSNGLTYTAYIPLVSNSMVYNPVDGLLYASIPGSVGTPLGNSVVSVDPATGAMGAPIFVGSEPNKLAVSSDGKTLWVGLDGSSAVRRVDLSSKTAGLQFSLPTTNNGIYNNPSTTLALAALPGSSTSVFVSTSTSGAPMLYDNGVLRGTTPTSSSYSYPYALQVDGTRSEVYAAGSGYSTYTYSSTGLTSKANNTSISPASSTYDEVQLLGGKLYTDTGKVYDAESGSLLGTLYLTGTTITSGTTLADSTLNKIFVLNNSTQYSLSYNQIQVFSLADYTSNGTTIPVNVSYDSTYLNGTPKRLTRWGANGLAFQVPYGIYSLRSNTVADLSGSSADLGVAVTTGGSTLTGASTTFTAKVTNNGPATATDTVLTLTPPAIGSGVSAVPSSGVCSAALSCSLGSLANGGSASVVLTVLQTTAGSSAVTAAVSGSTPDGTSSNNTATGTVTVTGNDFSLPPAIASLSPAAIQSGAADTVLTVNGSGFNSASTVKLGTASLNTSYVSGTKLTAIVPAANLASLGWGAVSVSTPAPGGGNSNSLPLTVYKVLTAGINHILYDPYSRQIMASVGSGSSTLTGNSIAAITPETGTFSTPVSIGSQPTNLGLSSDGQILYTTLSGAQSVARFNMLTRQADFTVKIPAPNTYDTVALRGVTVQPGTEDTVVLDLAAFTGNGIYDFNPTAQTVTMRGMASGPYTGSCTQFLDATNVFAFDTDTSGASLYHYTLGSAGFATTSNGSRYANSTLNRFGCFKLSGGLAYAINGGIANPLPNPALQVATLPLNTTYNSSFNSLFGFVPDASLQRAFYPAAISSPTSSTYDGIAAYNLSNYQLAATLPLNMNTTEGSTSYAQVDMVRWGQDGLAVLTSGGHIYLLRGPVVVPQLLGSNTAAALSSLSSSSVTHGTGNTVLTLTGSNFVPGVAVLLNGAYRTTTILDSTHLSVAIPASDLSVAGSATLTAVNPGASASGALTLTIN